MLENIKDKWKNQTNILNTIYKDSNKIKIIIFVLYKKEVPSVQNYVLKNHKNLYVGGISGEYSQYERTNTLDKFRDGKLNILIATDVAARGLDIPNVEYILNFTFPLTIEDYIHRIGRSGRAGKQGIAYTFFNMNENRSIAGSLYNVLRQSNQVIPSQLENCSVSIKKKSQHSMYGSHFRSEAGKSIHLTFD